MSWFPEWAHTNTNSQYREAHREVLAMPMHKEAQGGPRRPKGAQ